MTERLNGPEFNPAQIVRAGDGNVLVYAAANRGGRHLILRELCRAASARLLDSSVTWTAKELRVLHDEAAELARLADWRSRADELGSPAAARSPDLVTAGGVDG